jgi:hypothetical protein
MYYFKIPEFVYHNYIEKLRSNIISLSEENVETDTSNNISSLFMACLTRQRINL